MRVAAVPSVVRPSRPVGAPVAAPVAAAPASAAAADQPVRPAPVIGPAGDFKALSAAHRALRDAAVAALKLAEAAPVPGGGAAPAGRTGGAAARAAAEAASEALLAWTARNAADPANARFAEFFGHWLEADAAIWLAARPLPTRPARQGRYEALDQALQARPRDARARALVVAAARELVAVRPGLQPGAPGAAVKAAIAPALGHLARSADPTARELARRIAAGEIPLKISQGSQLGVQYYAVVAVSGITLSNGAVGPDFFELSPPFQAAVILHEYTHVQQKSSVGGFLGAMVGNLAQRGAALVAKLPGADVDGLERWGRKWNLAEQEAYRVEKDFLAALGWGERGLTVADAGMLEGVDQWLEDGRL